MALSILVKENVEAASANYPFGSIRDKTLSVGGTPVNRTTYTDMHQFFAKLMDYAGVTPNDLPDNDYSGWQLMEALMALMGNVKTKVLEIGSWDMDATALKQVTHGIDVGAGFINIKSISAIVRNDGSSAASDVSTGMDSIAINTTTIDLTRTSGGQFDTTGYDDTGINRGFIVIRYTESL